jgi:hypothetical protein
MTTLSNKYTPLPPPKGDDLQACVRWMVGELRRISSALEAHEATTINYGKEVRNIASSSTLAIDWRAGQKQRVEMSADCTFTFGAPEGVCNLMLRLVQDGTGGRDPTFPSSVKWQDGTAPTWATTANAVNVIAMYYDGTNYHATASLDSK